jgi:glycerophosphoryl diester phosphodiesterase
MLATRRTLLSVAAAPFASALAIPETQYRLIAHRGGLVDETHAENSPASIQGAIEEGFWMLEVDIRRTKDGEPVLQHDPDFRRYYNDPHKVDDLSWREIRQLRSTPGNTSPLHFSDLCGMCRGKTRLMLDIKGEDFPKDFYEKLSRALSDNNLLDTLYLLGGSERAKEVFGKAGRRPCTRETLESALDAGKNVSQDLYLFELASDLNERSVALSRKAGIPAVAAINTFRYTMAKRDEQKGAEEDAARMKQLGVTQFQIDSRYRALFA